MQPCLTRLGTAPRNLDCAGRRGQALMLLVKFMWHAWSNLQLFGIQVDSWNSLLFISECPPPPLPGCYIRKTNIQIPRPLTYFWVAQTNDPSAHRPITLWQEMEGAREGACREKPQFRHRIGCVALVLLASCKFLDIARYFQIKCTSFSWWSCLDFTLSMEMWKVR